MKNILHAAFRSSCISLFTFQQGRDSSGIDNQVYILVAVGKMFKVGIFIQSGEVRYRVVYNFDAFFLLQGFQQRHVVAGYAVVVSELGCFIVGVRPYQRYFSVFVRQGSRFLSFFSSTIDCRAIFSACSWCGRHSSTLCGMLA